MTDQNNTKVETAEQELARLRQENAQLRASQDNDSPTIKISEKGCVSVYGMGRFPVSLYRSKWIKLLGMTDQINAFLEQNKAQLDTVEGQFEAQKQAKKKVAA